MNWTPLVLVAAMILAGCATPDAPTPATTGPLSGILLFGEVAAQGIDVHLIAGTFQAMETSNATGEFAFANVPNGPCAITLVESNGDQHEISTTCPKRLEIQLGARATLPTLTEPEPPVTGPRTPQIPDSFLLKATVVTDAGVPLPNIDWRAERAGKTLASGSTDKFGKFFLEATPEHLDVFLESSCIVTQSFPLSLTKNTERQFILSLQSPQTVAVPTVTAAPGMQGTIALFWDHVEGSLGYEVTDGSQTIHTGGLAWMDHTPSGPYRVRALGPCLQNSEWSSEVDATPGSLPAHPDLLGSSAASPSITEHQFNVLDLKGETIGSIPWRVVEGTGNCCENFLATDRSGNIYDFGGESLFVSKDNGQSWMKYTNHAIQICGEGAVTPAHGGDIIGMNWEFCLGAGTEGVWSMKYIAADDIWVEGSQPIHTPFFDRPYISVGNGPYLGADGETAAMVSYIYTNYHDNIHGTGHGISYDGVTYIPDSAALFLSGTDSYTLPETLRYDADADWIQPQRNTHGRALDAGLHITDVALTSCQITDTPTGRGCSTPVLPLKSMQRDSEGRLHAVTFDDDARQIIYRFSDDVGRTWDEIRVAYIPQMVNNGGEWDLKAHAALDRTMIAMHADTTDGTAMDLVYMFRDIGSTPTLDRILQVGGGGGSGNSGLGADARYDFMSTGFLPDGRIVLSYRDANVANPAIAIGLTA